MNARLMRTAMVLLVTSCASARAGEEPVRAGLAKARGTFASASGEARRNLIAAFDHELKEVAKTGDLDAVQAVRALKLAFEEKGALPATPHLKVAAEQYEEAMKVARAAMDKAYEAAVREATKRLQVEVAETIRAEWKEFKARGTLPGDESGPDVAAAANKLSLTYSFYDWKLGDKPVKMLHKDIGFCYLIGINGALSGGGEAAQITLGKDGYWYLSGRSLAGGLNLRAVGVKVAVK